MEDQQELGFSFCCIIDAAVDDVFAAITDKAAISTYFTDARLGGARSFERLRSTRVSSRVAPIV